MTCDCEEEPTSLALPILNDACSLKVVRGFELAELADEVKRSASCYCRVVGHKRSFPDLGIRLPPFWLDFVSTTLSIPT